MPDLSFLTRFGLSQAIVLEVFCLLPVGFRHDPVRLIEGGMDMNWSEWLTRGMPGSAWISIESTPGLLLTVALDRIPAQLVSGVVPVRQVLRQPRDG